MTTGPDPDRIRTMFAAVAPKYDRANTILSAGIHHRWRKRVIRLAAPRAGERVLDCATGTGDLAIAFKHAVGADGYVLGTDFCPEMIDAAPAKAQREGLDIDFEIADVTALPYPDGDFDVSSIAFGIRNVGDPAKGLREMARVTRAGGRVVVLEFGQMSIPVVRNVYGAYAKHVLPRIGGWVTGQPKAYRYLETSSAQFPCGEAFCELMRDTGAFRDVTAHRLFGGVAYVYLGVVAG